MTIRVLCALLLLCLFCNPAFPAAEPETREPAPDAEVSESLPAEGQAKPEVVEEKIRSLRFVDNGNGTVLDTSTGLMWLKDANIFRIRVPWQTAKEFIKDLNGGKFPNAGHTDWRMPKIREIASLFDKSRYYPALPVGHPFENVQNDHMYWSSSGGFNIVGYAWLADISSGNVKYDYISYCNFQYVWPVRSTETTSKIEQSAKLSVQMSPTEMGLSFDDLACDVVSSSKPPPVPTGVTATAVSTQEIVVSWAESLESFNIAWHNIYEGKSFVKSVPENFASLKVPLPSTKRCYTVTAYNVIGIESEKSQQVCATTWSAPANSTVWSLGTNSFGQLGNGSKDDTFGLSMASSLSSVVNVRSGVEHSVAVKSDGTVWAWGRNIRGQLGDGTETDRNTPVQVKGLTNVVEVAAGWYHSIALKADGTVWAWGRNYYGQLGDGTQVDSNVPVQVSGLSAVKHIAAGWYHSLALRADGTVWAWGWNLKGQLGYGDTESKRVPVQVVGLSGVKDISGGMYHSLALKQNGEVWAWGWNEFGQLGTGTSKDIPFPARVKDIDNAVGIAGGMHYSLALNQDGTVWAWGRNDNGQLGMKSTSQSNLPVQVSGLEGVKLIAAGAYHGLALRDDGSLWLWGWDSGGRQEQSAPKRISGMSGIKQISAGINFTLALKE